MLGLRVTVCQCKKGFNFPEFSKCGAFRAPNGTAYDFALLDQPFDCSFFLINGMYRPVFNLVTGVYRRFRFVQSSHRSARTASIFFFFLFLFLFFFRSLFMWLLASMAPHPRRALAPLRDSRVCRWDDGCL